MLTRSLAVMPPDERSLLIDQRHATHFVVLRSLADLEKTGQVQVGVLNGETGVWGLPARREECEGETGQIQKGN